MKPTQLDNSQLIFSIKERDNMDYKNRKRKVDKEKEKHLKRDTLVQYDSIQSKCVSPFYVFILEPIPIFKSNSMQPRFSGVSNQGGSQSSQYLLPIMINNLKPKKSAQELMRFIN